MPWQIDGTFERKNPDFTGADVWQKDQLGSIKVIAFRHDDHDEDLALGIADCLNLDGLNAMRAILDMNDNVITGVTDGSVATEAVNFGQLSVVSDQVDINTAELLDTVEEAPIDGTSYSREDAGWVSTPGGANPNDLITSQSWDGQIFTSFRTNGNFITNMELLVPDDFRANGPIRHLGLVATTTIDPINGNRYLLVASADQDLDFILPTGTDGYLGDHYMVEGNVVIRNTGIATITLQEDGSPVDVSNIKGTQPTASGEEYTLTYIIHRTAGDIHETRYIWSA